MSRAGTKAGESDFARARRELIALFDEVAAVDWRHPAWNGLVTLLAADEARAQRRFTPERAVDAYVSALQANGTTAADTFMATHAGPPPRDAEARVAHAVARAEAVVSTLRALEGTSPDQRVLTTLRRDQGWLRATPLADASKVVFLVGGKAFLAEVPSAGDALVRALAAVVRGEDALPRVDPDAHAPTPAAAAIAVDPLPLSWARSFHRLAWTRGGGPWMGVADTPPYAVVSTCHSAVDGYMHARVTSAVLERAEPNRARPLLAPDGVSICPLRLGFASRDVQGRPRFARALHAFATVLDRRLGSSATRSVPIHVPIAPGTSVDATRWRRRPLYALLALEKHEGRLEDLDSFGARLPGWLAREAEGRGILTRVLRAALELPVPLALRRRLIARSPWMDRWVAPARTLTGAGYVSWMRFPPDEVPSIPIYPSAVPSFSADRGGAGLSIVVAEDGLTAGLTTSGALGTSAAAEDLLDEWVAELHAAPAPRIACANAS